MPDLHPPHARRGRGNTTAAFEVAPYVNEGSVEPLGPDRCRLVMGAWSWAGLAASIARSDADIEVVEPLELAHAFADLARRAAAAAAGHASSSAKNH